MTKNLEHLLGSDIPDDEAILAALDQIPTGELPLPVAQRILLDLDEKTNRFRQSVDVRLRLFELLPAGDLDVLDLVIAHLDLVSFRDVPDEIREHYLDSVDERISRLARPFAYLDPDELALDMATRVAGREVTIDEELPVEDLRRIRDLCDLIMGGGHFPSYDSPRTLRDVADGLERNL